MTVVYDETSIKRLKGLEGVRLRPGMYIPTTEHPHHLFKEVITNSIDERLVGFGDTIIVQKRDSTISIRDFGRGIPFGIHPEEKVSTLTLVATELHAGGKFSDNTYKVSGGLFGVGLSVVNALSSFLHIQSFRDGQSGYQQFSRGIPISEVIYSTTTEPNGTFISYIPDEAIFDSINSDVELLLQEIYFIVCLNNVKVVCDFDGKQLTLQDMSISTLIDKFSSHKSVEVPEFTFDHSVFFRFAFALSNDTSSRKFLFVNGVPVLKGNFLKIFFNSFAYYLNQAGLKFDSKDLHDTINLVLSIKAPVNIISFKGQVKEEANIDYSSMRQIFDYLFAFVFNSKSFQKLLKTQYKKAFAILLKRRKQDDEINKAFKELKKADSNSDSNLIVLPGKLTDCQVQNTGELFLVEGESSAGTGKQARDRKFQAILPLKGKILNVLKSNYATTMKNEVIQDLMIAIGISIKGKNIVINPRYNKIILSVDSDFDGSHIRTLLLAFFLKWGRPLIEHGYIYVSRLPIFLVRNKRLGSRFVYEEHLLQKKKGDVISRFKGLGEMNPDELETTLFNPQTRKLEQVKITNLAEAATICQALMGSESEMRASFLQYFSTEFDHINLDL